MMTDEIKLGQGEEEEANLQDSEEDQSQKTPLLMGEIMNVVLL